jgi:type IV pilus assembly protein PilW
VGSFTSSGQAIYGTGTGAGDTLAVRYVVSGSDNVINCSGSATTTAANVTNLFQIATVNGISYLQCVLTTTVIATGTTTVQTINLVPGITNMAVLYGVRTNGGSGTNSVDTYLNGTAVSAGNYWPYVLTAKVTLTFANPLYCAAGACQPGQTSTVAPTVLFGTVIDVMNHT